MNKYKYTQVWFLNSEIREKLFLFLNPASKNNMLEIGCFEGLSSVFFADNFLLNEKSTLTCVDPFLTIDTNDHKEFLKGDQESNFDYNISICDNSEKIKIRKITSDAFFKDNTETFNFIYIDGCHEPDFVIRDMENSFKVLERGGIMWMDDYRGGDGFQIKNAMDTFLLKYRGEYEIIYIGYQLALMKM
jgi:predicted O-methyltransferase YrrM